MACLALVLFFRHPRPLFPPSWFGVAGALFIGGATVASHYLMTLALGFEEAAVCAIVGAVEIPATYFLEFLIFRRSPTPAAAAGAVLVLGAVVGVSAAAAEEEEVEEEAEEEEVEYGAEAAESEEKAAE